MKTYPLSQSQLGVLIECMQHIGSTQYNVPFVTRLSTKVDPERLQSAIRSVLKTDCAFYTKIIEKNGEYRQYADTQMDIDIPIICKDEKKIKESIQQFIKPFDLMHDSLTRFMLIKTTENLYFLLDIHHIIVDGFSITEIFNNIEKAYHGEELIAHSRSIYEYAEKEKSSFSSDRYKKAALYYKDLFKEISMSSLPGKLNNETSICRQVTSHISVNEIKEFCRLHKVRPNLLFMSALELVISRITRESVVAYTTTYHGRTDREFDNSIGLFVKTIPFAIALDDTMNVVEFIHSHEDKWKYSKENSIYPFTHFCRDLNQVSEIGFSFQGSVVKMQNSFLGEIVNNDQYSEGTTTFTTAIWVYENINDYEIRVRYADVEYTEDFMVSFVNAFKTCVENIIGNPKCRLSGISIIDQFEQSAILKIAQGSTLSYNHTETFVDMFLHQASSSPQVIAVVDEVSSITYEELDHSSDLLASRLLELGIMKNNFVSIMLGYQKEFVIAAIGIEKAGGAYVPLDYEYPNDRLLYMLHDSESQVLITSHQIFEEKNNASDIFHVNHILFLDDLLAEGNLAKAHPVNLSTPDGLAYMIYTSGSTGKPKGVMISHQAKTCFIHSIVHEWHLTDESRISCHSSFSFDASVEDVYPVLTCGGVLYIVPDEIRKDMNKLYKFICDNNITGGNYTTQLGVMLASSYDLPLSYMVVGGEKMTINPDCNYRLINTYGPTEFTVDATFYELEKDKVYKNIPIGHPLSNLSAYVVDQCGQLVPHGIAGELCLSGEQMAAGYWKRPDLTEKVFVDCPFIQGKRMYRTGDLVRWNADNELEYLGRIDNQVKLRGFRIEMGEIETCAQSFSNDIKSVAAEVKIVNDIEYLCLYYTSTSAIDEKELKSYMSNSLADYMLPDTIIHLDMIPLTPNGKINRKLLPLPTVTIQTDNVKPADEKEQILFELASEILGTQDFGVTDDLESLGLTSLRAMKLTVMANNRGIRLKASNVMRKNSIRKILDGEDPICYWVNQYTEDKPVVVLFYFLTPYNLLVPLQDKLAERFSVLVVESISNHYDYLPKEKNVNHVVELYTSLIGLYVKADTKIQCFIGHCLAGEIAYRISAKWQQMTGQTVPAMMLNTNGFEFHRNNTYEKFVDSLPEAFKRRHSEKLKLDIKEEKIVTSLIQDNEPPIYAGRVIYYKATKKSPIFFENELVEDGEFEFLEAHKQDDMTSNGEYSGYWKRYAQNIEFRDIDGGHFEMLGDRFVGKYVDDISEL
jgi:amino acid adenylation domain-containing protein